MTMRLSLYAFTFWLSAVSFAQACDYCQKQVTLSQDLAQCYLTVYEDEIKRMKDSGLPAQLINLGLCKGVVKKKDRGTGVLPFPLSSEQQQSITASFLLDEGGIVCLAAELRTESWSANADAQDTLIKTFEVKRDC